MTGHEAKALLERFTGFLDAKGIEFMSAEDNGEGWDKWPKERHEPAPLIEEFVLQASEIR